MRVRCLVCEGQRREEKAGEEQAVERADAGGLGKCAPAGDLAGADALLLRLWGKEILEEGNNAFGHANPKPGSGIARLCKILRPCFVLLHFVVGAILDRSVGIVKPLPKKTMSSS